MADEDIRQLQREAAGGDPAAEARLLVERLRAGSLKRERLELAAGLGHGPARKALEDDVLEFEAALAFRRLAGLGKEAWVRAVVACLRLQPVAAGERNYVQRVLEAAEAWLACPCEDHVERARALREDAGKGLQERLRRFLGAERHWTANQLAEVVGRPWFALRGEVVCSGMTRRRADRLEATFREAGCLTRLVPDDDVPSERRRPAWGPRPPTTPLAGGQNLILEACGPQKIAVIKAIRAATSLSLAVTKQLTDHPGSVIPTGLSYDDAARLAGELGTLGAQVRIDPGEDGEVDEDSAPSWTLMLEDTGPKRISAIKEVRSATGLALREAKELTDRVSAPTPALVGQLDWDEIREALRAELVPWLLG